MNPQSTTAVLIKAALLAAAFGFAGSGFAAGDTSTTTQGATGAAKPMVSGSEAKAAAPTKAEAPDMAFKKLDMGAKGYVTKDDTRALSGFDKPFQDNDANHDGKLQPDEFKKAWAEFSGHKQ